MSTIKMHKMAAVGILSSNCLILGLIYIKLPFFFSQKWCHSHLNDSSNICTKTKGLIFLARLN